MRVCLLLQCLYVACSVYETLSSLETEDCIQRVGLEESCGSAGHSSTNCCGSQLVSFFGVLHCSLSLVGPRLLFY